MVMACDVICDAPTTRLLDQVIGKFAERASFAHAQAMDMSNVNSWMYNSVSTQNLTKDGTISFLLAMIAAKTVPQ